MKPLLSIQHLSCERRTRSGRLLLRGVDISAESRDFIGVIGPNGAGKTTLLRAILNLVPKRGDILIDGKNIDTLRRGELARLISMVPQRIEAIDWFTVEEMIAIGRTPYLGQFGGLHERDRETVETVLRMVDAAADRDRILTTLSGGEMQRVLIGRAIAQEPKVLLLDEPTAHLDIKYQLEVLDMLKNLLRGELVGAIRKPEAIVATFHNINLAADYCSKLVLLSKGEVVAQGTPEEVLTAENIRQVYGVEVVIDRHPKSGKPHYFILQ